MKGGFSRLERSQGCASRKPPEKPSVDLSQPGDSGGNGQAMWIELLPTHQGKLCPGVVLADPLGVSCSTTHFSRFPSIASLLTKNTKDIQLWGGGGSSEDSAPEGEGLTGEQASTLSSAAADVVKEDILVGACLASLNQPQTEPLLYFPGKSMSYQISNYISNLCPTRYS